MRRVVFRVDGNTSIGLGHLIRCIAIAEMLNNNFVLVWVTQFPEFLKNALSAEYQKNIIELPITTEFISDANHLIELLATDDIVVLDGYNFKSEYQLLIKQHGNKILLIDDLMDHHIYAHAVINHANGVLPSSYSIEKYTNLYLGSEYILLRKVFLDFARNNVLNKERKGVLVCMGGADPNNLTYTITKTIDNLINALPIYILMGNAFIHENSIRELAYNNSEIFLLKNLTSALIVDVINKVEFVICPASGFALEVAAINNNLIVGYSFDNQLRLYNGLIESGCAYPIGDLNNLDESNLLSAFKALINPEASSRQLESQHALIDGLSNKRILEIFNNLIN